MTYYNFVYLFEFANGRKVIFSDVTYCTALVNVWKLLKALSMLFSKFIHVKTNSLDHFYLTIGYGLLKNSI